MQVELFTDFVPVVPERLRRVREMRGLTQSDLAQAAGVDQSHVASIESGVRQPSRVVLSALADALRMPEEHFRQPVLGQLGEGTLRYRAKLSLGRRTAQRIRREAEHFLDVIANIAERVNAVPVTLKPLPGPPKEAAQHVRSLLQLGTSEPVAHLIRRIEKLGTIVVMLGPYSDFDAFADWGGKHRETPIIAASDAFSPDRLRMNVAHELGHLVLHRDSAIPAKQAEREAFAFAAELLMPERGVIRALATAGTNIEAMLQLKERWGVSVQALIRRAHELGTISDRQYRSMNTRINRLGWKFEEPGSVPPERALAPRKMAEVAFGNPLPFDRMARELHIPADQLREFMSRYAFVAKDQFAHIPIASSFVN